MADAYVEVHTEDDTGRGRRKIEQDSKRWADKLGLGLGSSIGSGLLRMFTSTITKGLAAAFKISMWIAIGTAIAAALQGASSFIYTLLQAGPAVALVAPAVLSLISVFGALKVATSGVGEAFKANATGNAEKFNEAMKKLAPSAQAVVKQMVALKPQMDALKKSVQGAFFQGLGAKNGPIATLATLYLPLIRVHLTGVATEVNNLVRALIAMATQPAFLRDWASTLANVRVALGAILGSLTPLLSIMRDIGTVAAPIFAAIAVTFGSWAAHLAGVVTQMRATGELTRSIQAAVIISAQFFQMLGNIGSVVLSLFQAMSSTGGSVFGVFGDLLGQLADFLNSAAGVKTLLVFFTAVHDAAVTLGPAVIPTFKAIGSVLVALAPFLPILAGVIAQALTILGPVLKVVATSLSAALTALAPVVPVLAQGLAAIATALAPILPLLAQFIAAAVTGLVPLLTALGPAVALFAAAWEKGLMAILPAVLDILGVLSGVLVDLAPTFVILVGLVAQFVKALAGPLSGLLHTLATTLLQLAPSVVKIIQVLAPLIAMIVGAFAGALQRVIPLLVPLVEILIQALQPVLEALAPVIAQLATSFGGVLVAALLELAQILGQILPVFGQMVAVVLPELIPLIEQFGLLLINLMPVLGPLLLLLIKIALFTMPVWITVLEAVVVGLTKLLQFVNAIVAPLAGFIGMILSVIGSLIDLGGMLQLAQRIWEWFRRAVGQVVHALGVEIADWFNGIRAKFDAFVGFFRNLGKTLGGALSGAASWLLNIGKDLIGGLWRGIESMGGWLKDKLYGWVKDHIPGPIASILGIASASKVGISLGRWFAVGIGQGVDKGGAMVAAAAGRLAQAMIPNTNTPGLAMAGGGAPAVTPAGAFGPYTVQVGPHELAQFVIDAVTGAPRPVAANISGSNQAGRSYSYRGRS